MVKNFNKMPAFLKLLTASSVVFPLFMASSIREMSINIFGSAVSREVWWGSGCGVFFSD